MVLLNRLSGDGRVCTHVALEAKACSPEWDR